MPDGQFYEGPRMLRFKVNYDKCIDGIALLAEHKPGITQYYIGKVFFFADKEHLLDWGRPISGDHYVAMDHGPVPSVIYDMLKDDAGLPDEVNEKLASRISITLNGKKREVYAHATADNHRWQSLSKDEVKYLLDSLKKYGNKSFTELRNITHNERAWADAYETGSNNAPMDYEKLIPDSFDDRSAFVEQIKERAAFDRA
ncbi:Uncharacterized phage-associated protein [Enhydrobacter aerosaccus]|uniref:Uncharacterized phage-associated protein n=1 Tax=Enhydrobacter aerosaccus TaxID=225324 RepID=A0A1T4TML0_9HYPH|nr:Panacea domain-containing protein [Enhydrobacter aerosaccus]SKA41706.1 Uncharacterized phage-associated protein [Enhydrobacter aerosaccus]